MGIQSRASQRPTSNLHCKHLATPAALVINELTSPCFYVQVRGEIRGAGAPHRPGRAALRPLPEGRAPLPSAAGRQEGRAGARRLGVPSRAFGGSLVAGVHKVLGRHAAVPGPTVRRLNRRLAAARSSGTNVILALRKTMPTAATPGETARPSKPICVLMAFACFHRLLLAQLRVQPARLPSSGQPPSETLDRNHERQSRQQEV
eukprot:COSAG04_NODE_8_length_44311_cov_99.067531_8_plen_204_part_00